MPRTSTTRTRYRNQSTVSPLNAARGNRLFSMSFWLKLLGTRTLPSRDDNQVETAEGVINELPCLTSRSGSSPVNVEGGIRGLHSDAKVLLWLNGAGQFEEPEARDIRGQSPAASVIMPGGFMEGSICSGYLSDGTNGSFAKGSQDGSASESESEGRNPNLDLYWDPRPETEDRVQAIVRDDGWEIETERESRSPSPWNRSGSDTSREGSPVKGNFPQLDTANSFNTLVVLQPLLGNAPAGGSARVEYLQANLRRIDPEATPTEVDSQASSDTEHA